MTKLWLSLLFLATILTSNMFAGGTQYSNESNLTVISQTILKDANLTTYSLNIISDSLDKNGSDEFTQTEKNLLIERITSRVSALKYVETGGDIVVDVNVTRYSETNFGSLMAGLSLLTNTATIGGIINIKYANSNILDIKFLNYAGWNNTLRSISSGYGLSCGMTSESFLMTGEDIEILLENVLMRKDFNSIIITDLNSAYADAKDNFKSWKASQTK